MDQIGRVLEVMAKAMDAVTVRHITGETGIATSTLVGVIMAMIRQGYIREVHSKGTEPGENNSRCTCVCCNPDSDHAGPGSWDQRFYQITPKGLAYLQNWNGKTR
ncbi:MAG: hypothetical protein LUQ50_05240 [Methanospirillum sp.]|uniref:hypothetical protein n=1 Tax=Methanospirillum sp. TaxID=45200 RepID=UPI00236A1871|nr:hypothetical protein [Methanospirillum sp.]MDD1728457.1 hypothetical protein [Methanospirillum sp.]